MKKLISVFFAIFIIFIVVFAIIKFLIGIQKQKENSLSHFANKSSYETSKKSKIKHIYEGIFWDKNDLYVSIDHFQVEDEQVDLMQMQKYYLFLRLSNNDSCYFGEFIYKYLANNFLIFSASRNFKLDKFINYACFLNEKIMLTVYNESGFYAENNKQTCQFWVKINN